MEAQQMAEANLKTARAWMRECSRLRNLLRRTHKAMGLALTDIVLPAEADEVRELRVEVAAATGLEVAQ